MIKYPQLLVGKEISSNRKFSSEKFPARRLGMR